MRWPLITLCTASLAAGVWFVTQPQNLSPPTTQKAPVTVIPTAATAPHKTSPHPDNEAIKNVGTLRKTTAPEGLGEEIRLTGIIENASDPQLSYAIIENSFTKGRPSSVGSTIKPGITLTQIYSDHIYVKKNNRRYRVNIVQATPSSFSNHTDSSGLPASGTASPVYRSATPPPLSHRVSTPLAANYQPGATNNRGAFTTTDRDEDSLTKNSSTSRSAKMVAAGASNYQPNAGTRYAASTRTASSRQESLAAAGTTNNKTQTDDGMPDFMHVAGNDAYVPEFMRGGELSILWEQVPDYMKAGSE